MTKMFWDSPLGAILVGLSLVFILIGILYIFKII